MDFSWFATIPGMLITGGVLLLIISLVMFIAMSNKKDKTKSDASKKSEEEAKNMVNEMEQGIAIPVDNTIGSNNVIDPMNVSNGVNVSENPVVDNQMNNNNGINDLSNMSVDGALGTEVTAPEVSTPVASFDVPLASDSQPNSDAVSLSNNDVMSGSISATESSNINDVTATVMPDAIPTSPIMPEVAASPVDSTNTSVESTIPVVEPSVTSNAAPIADVDVTPTIPNVSAVDVHVPVTNQMEEPGVSNPVDVNSATEVSTTDASPVVAPISAVDAVSSVTPELSPVNPVVDVNPQPSVPIYGGVAPAIPNVTVEQESHQIYGGANPLENTQNISIADINQAAAAAISHNTVTTTPPVVGVPNVAPVQNVEVVPAAPVQPQVAPVTSVAPVQPVTPEVVATPNVVSTTNQGQ